jgi:hypothetical protein
MRLGRRVREGGLREFPAANSFAPWGGTLGYVPGSQSPSAMTGHGASPAGYSLFPIPYSLFPIPYSLFPIPYYLFPIPSPLPFPPSPAALQSAIFSA